MLGFVVDNGIIVSDCDYRRFFVGNYKVENRKMI